jgi:hypothetical protein
MSIYWKKSSAKLIFGNKKINSSKKFRLKIELIICHSLEKYGQKVQSMARVTKKYSNLIVELLQLKII